MSEYPARRAGLLFLSFDTTGADPEACSIVGTAWGYSGINTEPPLIATPLIQEALTVYEDIDVLEPEHWDEDVYARAVESGLIPELAKVQSGEAMSTSLEEIEEIIISDAHLFYGDGREYPVHVVGIGVSQFEQVLLRRFMPKLCELLHPQPVDVTPAALVLDWAKPGKMSHFKAYRAEPTNRSKDRVLKGFAQFEDQFRRAEQS